MDTAQRDDWGAFFALYRAIAERVAYGLLGDLTAAEDAVQDAARSLVERAREGRAFETRAHARNWFLRAVRNRAASSLRARGRSRVDDRDVETVAGVSDPAEEAAARDEAAARRELATRVEGALGELSTGEQEALDLRYREGLPYRTMAARTGTAASTLQARVEAGLQKLRLRLGRISGGAKSGVEDP